MISSDIILKNIPNFHDEFKEILSFSENYESEEFFDKPGRNHYYLLAYLSTLFNNSNIIDIGTHLGKSSLALSYNKTNVVHTFNIEDQIKNSKIKDRQNIQFHIENILEDSIQEKWYDIIINTPIIVFDIEPHNGSYEYEFYKYLMSIGYQGIVVWDDIWYFKEMRDNFWYLIPNDIKYDLTLIGHWSGTGITCFAKNNPICKILPKIDISNWTIVTAYFDLTKYDDANMLIKERDNNYYFTHAISTLSLPWNMVIYCDLKSLKRIQTIRSFYLREQSALKTRYIIRDFDNLKFNKNGNIMEKRFNDYRNQIKNNRVGKQIYNDERNNPSYYLFCISRYLFLQETIEQNPFESTHFAWLNFCIERMGYSNLLHLEEALSINRDKFSTCYIDYVPEDTVRNLPYYYMYGGRCSMCSGFFTGNSAYMYKACELVIDYFLKFLDLGYGHADEQLFSAIYFDYPNIFCHYYGDYHQMCTNYVSIYENAEAPIYNFIRNSFKNHNYIKCLEACQYVLKSYNIGNCTIQDGYLQELKERLLICENEVRNMNH